MSALPKFTAPAFAPAPAAPSMEAHWLPFTPNREFKQEPKLVARAEGMYYWTPDGRKVIDGSSGLFTCAAGHGRREIAEAVHRQLLELDFTPNFLRSHPKAFELANRLAAILPAGLDRVFFVNSGSEAVDTAMKLALAYHRAKKEGTRQLFVSRERAYHGVNFGGIALSGIVNNRRAFAGVPGAVAHMRHTWLAENRFERGQPPRGAELAEDLARLVQLHGAENIAACVVEPVAGSTGVLVPPRGYLERLRAICDAHGILLVFDEVICGFGRTGAPFGAQSFGVTPDIVTMAKAITNGAVPMAAVAARREIHDTLMAAAPEGAIEFFHGYTWSAHPVACAAALAAQDIYRDERLFERAAALSPYFLDAMWSLRDAAVVSDIRGCGFLAGIEVAPDGAPGRRGHRWQKQLFDAGMHIKTTGDAGIIAPPLVAEKAHIDEMTEKLRAVLKAL